MTKPLQGALFKRFRDQITGVVAAQDPGCGKKKKPKSQTKNGSTERTSEITGVCWETAAPTEGRPYENQDKTRTP